MKKREFLKTSGVLLTGAILTGFGLGCKPQSETSNEPTKDKDASPKVTDKVIFTLPALDYAFDALQPIIDKETMEIHHDKHHAGYVKNLNKALETNTLLALPTVEDICKAVSNKDADLAVRNNAGGHFNHSLYWSILGNPAENKAKMPSGKLLEAINSAFGSFEAMKTKLSDAAMTRFGSGWAWLMLDGKKNLAISSTPNQDNPLMLNCVSEVGVPLIGIDVWEHAYYLNYQNKRKDYVTAFFDLLRWDKIDATYQSALR
jgi:superoxide dismutase, Fe-Mn family